jgi:hypothetical protein
MMTGLAGHGQADNGAGPGPVGIIPQQDQSSMFLDYFFNNCQTQSRPLLLGGHIRFEYGADDILGDPWARVQDPYLDVIDPGLDDITGGDLKAGAAERRTGVEGVIQNVIEDLP